VPLIPQRATGSPRSAAVTGRAGGAAGLPVQAVALDDGGDVLGADAMQMQVQSAAALDRGQLRAGERELGRLALYCRRCNRRAH
jgi:hypothetical protein